MSCCDSSYSDFSFVAVIASNFFKVSSPLSHCADVILSWFLEGLIRELVDS